MGYALAKRVLCSSLYVAYVGYSMRMRQSKVTRVKVLASLQTSRVSLCSYRGT
jgi:hypothetical protein